MFYLPYSAGGSISILEGGAEGIEGERALSCSQTSSVLALDLTLNGGGEKEMEKGGKKIY